MVKWMIAGLVVLAVASVAWRMWPRMVSVDALAARHAAPLAAPDGPLRVYHLGHSLVGRDMPAMLAQLAGHSYGSQLGWGASLKQHWDGDVPGFAEENASAAFRAAEEMAAFDAVVLTEMVELRDAMRYHDSGNYLAGWADKAGNARVYLYETWHRLDDPAGWLDRIDADRAGLWDVVLRQAMARTKATIRVVPGGGVMAAVVRKMEAGEVPGLTRREELFVAGDTIHLNDVGNYVMALTHYAVLYQRSPVGLPHDLQRADGVAMTAIGRETARVLQQVVWDVVTSDAATGVGQER